MTPQLPTDVTNVVRINQIIAGAQIAGVVTFGVVVVVIAWNKPPGNAPFALIAAGTAIVAIVLRFVMGGSIVSGSRTQIANDVRSGRLQDTQQIAGRLYATHRMQMIVGLGILEGMAFLNLIAYMLVARWWNLAAAGVLLLLMAAMFPTKNKLEQWVHDQLQLMEIERTAAP